MNAEAQANPQQQTDPGTLLVLATYGLEIVEVGGTIAGHVRAGGRAHATVTLARPEARDQIARAAEILGASLQFMEFSLGSVGPDVESKKRFVRVIREVRPDIVITQDPEHSFHDLDPDRRQAMILYVKERALAELRSQHAFSARSMRQRLPADLLSKISGVEPGADDEALGLSMHRRMDHALHLYHGLMSHSARAALAEPFRREGLFTLPNLVR